MKILTGSAFLNVMMVLQHHLDVCSIIGRLVELFEVLITAQQLIRHKTQLE